LNAGAQDTFDVVIRIEPLDPILTITHFVRNPFLSNSCPANIGCFMPVNASAWQIINISGLGQEKKSSKQHTNRVLLLFTKINKEIQRNKENIFVLHHT
jgi:hypothetical protein